MGDTPSWVILNIYNSACIYIAENGSLKNALKALTKGKLKFKSMSETCGDDLISMCLTKTARKYGEVIEDTNGKLSPGKHSIGPVGSFTGNFCTKIREKKNKKKYSFKSGKKSIIHQKRKPLKKVEKKVEENYLRLVKYLDIPLIKPFLPGGESGVPYYLSAGPAVLSTIRYVPDVVFTTSAKIVQQLYCRPLGIMRKAQINPTLPRLMGGLGYPSTTNRKEWKLSRKLRNGVRSYLNGDFYQSKDQYLQGDMSGPVDHLHPQANGSRISKEVLEVYLEDSVQLQPKYGSVPIGYLQSAMPMADFHEFRKEINKEFIPLRSFLNGWESDFFSDQKWSPKKFKAKWNFRKFREASVGRRRNFTEIGSSREQSSHLTVTEISRFNRTESWWISRRVIDDDVTSQSLWRDAKGRIKFQPMSTPQEDGP
jgi:hypothetical protein